MKTPLWNDWNDPKKKKKRQTLIIYRSWKIWNFIFELCFVLQLRPSLVSLCFRIDSGQLGIWAVNLGSFHFCMWFRIQSMYLSVRCVKRKMTISLNAPKLKQRKQKIGECAIYRVNTCIKSEKNRLWAWNRSTDLKERLAYILTWVAGRTALGRSKRYNTSKVDIGVNWIGIIICHERTTYSHNADKTPNILP